MSIGSVGDAGGHGWHGDAFAMIQDGVRWLERESGRRLDPRPRVAAEPAPAATPRCLACDRSDVETPLVPLDFRGERRWICPQHLPLLIHDPARLAGRLPGAEDLRPADTASHP